VVLTWLANGSESSLRHALKLVAPELADTGLSMSATPKVDDERWWASSAAIDSRLVVKFAWSEPAAEALWSEGQILGTLADLTPPLRVPRVALASSDPVLVLTEKVTGEPLTYDYVGQTNSDGIKYIATELASFLAELHRPEVLESVTAVLGVVQVPEPQATTATLRERMAPWIRPEQFDLVLRWCDWTDAILRSPAEAVLVHGDLHGHNELWDFEHGVLTAVIDFGDAGACDPEYDFRYLPSQGPVIDFFTSVVIAYEQLTSRRIDVHRVMAWHMRSVLGDALWRSEASVALPGGGTPATWVDELHGRLQALRLEI
jgi:aminoglycoside phosphotransferase (APT) family kinase protein